MDPKKPPTIGANIILLFVIIFQDYFQEPKVTSSYCLSLKHYAFPFWVSHVKRHFEVQYLGSGRHTVVKVNTTVALKM